MYRLVMVQKLIISVQPETAAQVSDVQAMLGLPSPAAAARYLITNGLVQMQSALGSWRAAAGSREMLGALPGMLQSALLEESRREDGQGPGPSSTRSSVSPVTGPPPLQLKIEQAPKSAKPAKGRGVK